MKKIIFAVVCVMMFASMAFSAEKVKAYTTMEEPLAKALFDEFEKETGIKVEWVRLSGGEAIARLEAERANPQASIWVEICRQYSVTLQGRRKLLDRALCRAYSLLHEHRQSERTRPHYA